MLLALELQHQCGLQHVMASAGFGGELIREDTLLSNLKALKTDIDGRTWSCHLLPLSLQMLVDSARCVT